MNNVKTCNILEAVLKAEEGNEKLAKYKEELGEHYKALLAILPPAHRERLHRFYALTVGIETETMTTAYKLGGAR